VKRKRLAPDARGDAFAAFLCIPLQCGLPLIPGIAREVGLHDIRAREDADRWRIELQNSASLFRRSQRHLRSVAILVEARRRGPMRAYVTAAGMALGLVGVWAALVPFVA
jgi:hypothetical protein